MPIKRIGAVVLKGVWCHVGLRMVFVAACTAASQTVVFLVVRCCLCSCDEVRVVDVTRRMYCCAGPSGRSVICLRLSPCLPRRAGCTSRGRSQCVWSCFDTGRCTLAVVTGDPESARSLVTLDVAVTIAPLGSAPSTRTWTPVSDACTSVYEARSSTTAAVSTVSVLLSDTRQSASSSSRTWRR